MPDLVFQVDWSHDSRLKRHGSPDLEARVVYPLRCIRGSAACRFPESLGILSIVAGFGTTRACG